MVNRWGKDGLFIKLCVTVYVLSTSNVFIRISTRFNAKLHIAQIVVIFSPDPHSALPIHMHSVVCHMGIDHAVMGYVTDKIYKQRST